MPFNVQKSDRLTHCLVVCMKNNQRKSSNFLRIIDSRHSLAMMRFDLSKSNLSMSNAEISSVSSPIQVHWIVTEWICRWINSWRIILATYMDYITWTIYQQDFNRLCGEHVSNMLLWHLNKKSLNSRLHSDVWNALAGGKMGSVDLKSAKIKQLIREIWRAVVIDLFHLYCRSWHSL